MVLRGPSAHPAARHGVAIGAALLLLAGCGGNGGQPNPSVESVPSRGCAAALIASAPGAPMALLTGCTATPPSQEPTMSPGTPPPVGTPRPTAPASIPPRGTVDGQPFPVAPCCTGIEAPAGRYAVPEFVPLAMSVEIGAGWRAYQNETDGVATFVQGNSAVGHATQWLLFSAATPDVIADFVDEVRGTPGLTVEPAHATTVAGIDGLLIEAQARPNPSEAGGPARLPGTIEIRGMRHVTRIPHGWVTESREARIWIFLLPATPELTVVVYAEAPPLNFDAFGAQVDGILQTLHVATG
jgi:hypothetical protein